MTETRDDYFSATPGEAAAPTVAVIIPTYNRAHLLGHAIDSILAQTLLPHQIIVVDDGSTDDTAQVIASREADIEYIWTENRGKPHALNLALPKVKSHYVCIFDDDDLMLPEALATHVRYLSQNPDRDFTFSDHYMFSASLDTQAVVDHGRAISLPSVPTSQFFLWTMEQSFLPTHMQGMLIPMHCYERVGLFDPTLLRCEDHDMVCRIARYFRAGHIQQPLWGFREHEGPRGPSFESHSVDKRYDVFRKYKKHVFEKIYQDVAIEEYALPDSTLKQSGKPSDDKTLLRQALLTRARIMSTHGLYEHAQTDFAAFMRLKDTGLTQEERQLISRLLLIDDASNIAPTNYFRKLGNLIDRNHDSVRAGLKGLYWSLMRELRLRRWGNALRVTGATQSFLRGAILRDRSDPAR
ncbi:MAG: glycosyltransferase family A protein [Salinisphaera sp.]|jgi:glycosyltransferase involved in cell wall biosynthesis|nr:glycosyltransferase family A protein [Salinisphaera sp.]